jgi:uncharacterized Zn finger protein (UPF0148 family)
MTRVQPLVMLGACSTCDLPLPADASDWGMTQDGRIICPACFQQPDVDADGAVQRSEARMHADPEQVRASQDADYDRRWRELEGQEALDAAMNHALEVRRNRGPWKRLLSAVRHRG